MLEVYSPRFGRVVAKGRRSAPFFEDVQLEEIPHRRLAGHFLNFLSIASVLLRLPSAREQPRTDEKISLKMVYVLEPKAISD